MTDRGARPARVIAALVAAVCAGACLALRPTETPIPTVTLADGAPGGDCLVLFLPGHADQPEDFVAAGFAEIARNRGIDAEIVAVDAHLGYLLDRSLLERLREDVIAPARRRGVDEIWWVGISLGGAASLLVLEGDPEAVDGVVLLAPFLGEGPAVESVLAARELAAWRPDPTLDGGPDGLWLRLWQELQREVGDSGDGPPLYLGFGDRDRYREAHRVLAAALPDERVRVVPGGHDWGTWTRLWSDMTADGLPLCGG